MSAPIDVSLPHTMLQKLLDLLKLESLKFCLKIHVHVIRHIRYQVNIDYHNQHESAALIGPFHTTSSVLPSVESYPNYRKPTQRGVQGYLSSLQRRVHRLRSKKHSTHFKVSSVCNNDSHTYPYTHNVLNFFL